MAKDTKAPETEYEEVYVPRRYKGEDSLFVCVNGEHAQVRCGETVRMKKKFAEVIKNSLAQDRAYEKMMEALAAQSL